MAPNTDIATRAMIVTLKSPAIGKTTTEIAQITGISSHTINTIYARAIQRGFDPNVLPLKIQDGMLKDASRSGRPSKQTDELRDSVLQKLRGDGQSQESRCTNIADSLGQEGIKVSTSTVRRVIKKSGLRKTKETPPGSTRRMEVDEEE